VEKQNSKPKKRTLASKNFNIPLSDFILSRQAMMCTPRTIAWYEFNLNKIIAWFDAHDVESPREITSRHVRMFLGEMISKGYSDSYVHAYARVLRTFTRFLHKEKYIDELVDFDMPKVAKKQLRFYSKQEVGQIIQACKDKRDRALILLMIDSGLRLSETIALNWGDVDVNTGVIKVVSGKGRKARMVMIGFNARRALLKYLGQVASGDEQPVFQSQSGKRFTVSGMRSWVLRIGKRAGIKLSPHALRRTFATLALKAGMNVFQLQGLLGHSSLEMTRRYVALLNEDLIDAHKKHGPIDHLLG
jgi:site-specific recombinase XerD